MVEPHVDQLENATDFKSVETLVTNVQSGIKAIRRQAGNLGLDNDRVRRTLGRGEDWEKPEQVNRRHRIVTIGLLWMSAYEQFLAAVRDKNLRRTQQAIVTLRNLNHSYMTQCLAILKDLVASMQVPSSDQLDEDFKDILKRSTRTAK